MKNKSIVNFRENLRSAVGRLPSISHAAKELDINRQQLNKYLAGTSTPSIATLSAFARYFNVLVDDLFLAPEEFKRIHEPDDTSENLPSELSESIRHLTQHSNNTQSLLKMYCGTYFRVSSMPFMPHQIIRALTHIYQRNGFTYATTIEVFPTTYSNLNGGRHVRKLHALVLHYSDRIYMLDASRSTRLMMMIFYPESIPGFEYLQGHAMSVSDVGARRIFNLPFVLQTTGSRKVRKSDLRACGIFDANGPEISAELRIRLKLNG